MLFLKAADRNGCIKQVLTSTWLIFTQDILLAWMRMRNKKNKKKRRKKQTLCTCYKWFLFSDATARFTQWHPQIRPSVGYLATAFVLHPAGSRICISCSMLPNHLFDGPPFLLAFLALSVLDCCKYSCLLTIKCVQLTLMFRFLTLLVLHLDPDITETIPSYIRHTPLPLIGPHFPARIFLLNTLNLSSPFYANASFHYHITRYVEIRFYTVYTYFVSLLLSD